MSNSIYRDPGFVKVTAWCPGCDETTTHVVTGIAQDRTPLTVRFVSLCCGCGHVQRERRDYAPPRPGPRGVSPLSRPVHS